MITKHFGDPPFMDTPMWTSGNLWDNNIPRLGKSCELVGAIPDRLVTRCHQYSTTLSEIESTKFDPVGD